MIPWTFHSRQLIQFNEIIASDRRFILTKLKADIIDQNKVWDFHSSVSAWAVKTVKIVTNLSTIKLSCFSHSRRHLTKNIFLCKFLRVTQKTSIACLFRVNFLKHSRRNLKTNFLIRRRTRHPLITDDRRCYGKLLCLIVKLHHFSILKSFNVSVHVCCVHERETINIYFIYKLESVEGSCDLLGELLLEI